MRIDLHTHSTVSDGSLTPVELVAAASAARLDIVALTDHDTTAGWTPAAAALRGEPGALRGEPGALRGEPGALRGEPGALRGEPGALRGEPGALRGEPGALRGEPGASPGDLTAVAGPAPVTGAGLPGLTLVPGAELSCRWYGVAPPIPLHLLAYLFDPAHIPLAAEMARVREARERRAQRIVDALRADGIDITWDEVIRYAGAASVGQAQGASVGQAQDASVGQAQGASVGRPHIAQALIRRGLVATTAEAFRPEWLGERYRLPKEDTDVFTALRLVRDAGGVSVFAHPRATRRGRIVPDELIVALAAEGLFGLEADHPDHRPEERDHVRRLATRLGLAVTGSSDFHGTHKTVALGAFLTATDVYARLIEAAARRPAGR